MFEDITAIILGIGIILYTIWYATPHTGKTFIIMAWDMLCKPIMVTLGLSIGIALIMSALYY